LKLQNQYATPAHSPPPSSNVSNSGVGGDFASRVLAPKSNKVEKSTPKRKKERAKPIKNLPPLEKPLSELTKDIDAPIADIEQWVNRPEEVRRGEIDTGKNPGRIKRPMNAFMLYRKAFQERAKKWLGQHNHQIVSKVCGASWTKEPESLRAKFRDWAEIERANHHKAHPNYKFTPSKPSKSAAQSDRGLEDSDGSELGDMDWMSTRDPQLRSATHTPPGDSDYMSPGSIYTNTQVQPQPFAAGIHPMSFLTQQARGGFDYHHLTKPLGGGFPNHGLSTTNYFDAQYRGPAQQLQQLQQPLHADGLANHHHRGPSPSMAFQQQSNAGMHAHYLNSQSHGAAAEHQLLQSHQHHSQPASQRLEQRIDPLLMPHDNSGMLEASHLDSSLQSLFDGSLAGSAAAAGTGAGATSQNNWQQQTTTHITTSAAGTVAATATATAEFSLMAELEETLSLEQHTQFLRGADEWHIEQLPEGTGFDTNWVEPKADA
jgi:hypothetical protein